MCKISHELVGKISHELVCKISYELVGKFSHEFLALTEANGRPGNIMHEVEVKLSAMHLGGRKMVLYLALLKLVLQETCVSAFCTFMVKFVAFRKMSPDS